MTAINMIRMNMKSWMFFGWYTENKTPQIGHEFTLVVPARPFYNLPWGFSPEVTWSHPYPLAENVGGSQGQCGVLHSGGHRFGRGPKLTIQWGVGWRVLTQDDLTTHRFLPVFFGGVCQFMKGWRVIIVFRRCHKSCGVYVGKGHVMLVGVGLGWGGCRQKNNELWNQGSQEMIYN